MCIISYDDQDDEKKFSQDELGHEDLGLSSHGNPYLDLCPSHWKAGKGYSDYVPAKHDDENDYIFCYNLILERIAELRASANPEIPQELQGLGIPALNEENPRDLDDFNNEAPALLEHAEREEDIANHDPEPVNDNDNEEDNIFGHVNFMGAGELLNVDAQAREDLDIIQRVLPPDAHQVHSELYELDQVVPQNENESVVIISDPAQLEADFYQLVEEFLRNDGFDIEEDFYPSHEEQ